LIIESFSTLTLSFSIYGFFDYPVSTLISLLLLPSPDSHSETRSIDFWLCSMLLELLDTDQAEDHQGYSQEEEWDPTGLHKDLGQSHDDGRQDHYSTACDADEATQIPIARKPRMVEQR
jgi:hypothetical protein